MRKVLVLIVCCISAVFVYANDGAFYAEGNHLIPITETDIRVQKEVLTLNRVNDKIEVTVYYEFFNPVGEKEVLVGFEAQAPDVLFNETSVKMFPQHPYMRNFKVVMNGEPLTFEVAHASHDDYYVDGKIKSASIKELELEEWMNDVDGDEEAALHPYLYVYHFNANFRPGLNIIQHTYDFDMSDERNGFTKDFFYILTAANRWANHRIDDFTLYVDMGDHTSFHISPTFFKSLDEWEILGVGKKEIGTVPYQVRPDSLFFHMQQGNIRFRRENFHPDGELRITRDLIWGYWTWIIREEDKNKRGSFDTESFVNRYKLQYESIGLYGALPKEETYYDQFSQEQRRILKNLPFAYRGYIFNSKELQDFYESTAWYIPNPDYKADMQKLSEEEQKWVEFWSPSDLTDNPQVKEIEKRVTDIYNHVFTEYVKLCDSHQVPSVDTFNSLYFSKDFLHLNQMIGDLEEQSGGPIVNDVDNWICAQDWDKDLEANVLRVKMVDDKKAMVDVNIHNCGNDHKQTLILINERGNWYIDDMYVSSMRKSILEAIEDCKKDGLVPRIR